VNGKRPMHDIRSLNKVPSVQKSNGGDANRQSILSDKVVTIWEWPILLI